MVVYDTYAWIEYFRGTEKGEIIKKLLEKSELTPTIVLAEITRKYIRKGNQEEETKNRLLYIQARTDIAYITPEISIKAAKIYLEHKKYTEKHKLRTPSLADAIIYTTSLQYEPQLVTGDKLFKKTTQHNIHWILARN